jgi:hypothetical protein
MLLIITSDQDLTADFLIVDLLNRGLPYFRMNSEELSTSAATFAVERDGVSGGLSVGKRHVRLSEVSSVWYRRAIYPAAAFGMTASEQAFVVGEMRHFFSGLVLNPGITWVNPIENVRVAEHKLFQLRVAHELGLRVPRTVVSADAEILRKFTLSNPNGTICKPIYHGLFRDGEARHSILTRRVRPEELDTEAVRLCPVLLQEEIPRRADVRATFVGRHLYVADIGGIGEAVDWRDPELPVTYASSTLPPVIEARCRKMLSKLGLVYGAFDFIKTLDGDYVFLEVNPTGEWAWLENTLGFPIRSALVEVLYRVDDAR